MMKNNRSILHSIIRVTFKKLTVKKKADPTVLNVLQDMAKSVMDSMRSGDVESFRRSLQDLIEFHVSILEAAASPLDKNENFAALPRSGLWGIERFRDWTSVYRPMLIESVKKVENDENFYRFLAHSLVSGLYARSAATLPGRISRHFIMWATFPLTALSAEIQRRKTVFAGGDRGNGDNVPLPRFLTALYSPQLKYYLSAWEALQDHVVRFYKSEGLFKVQRFDDLVMHMLSTMEMVCRMVTNGDQLGSEWLLDSFLRWNDRISYLNNQQLQVLERRSEQLSDFRDALSQRPVDTDGGMNARLQRVLKHFWFDVSVVSFGILCSYANAKDHSLGYLTAKLLYDQTITDSSSRHASMPRLGNLAELFTSFVRLMIDRELESSINDQLENGLDSAIANGVPGRVYTSGGGGKTFEAFILLGLVGIYRPIHNISRKKISAAVDEIAETGAAVDSVLSGFRQIQQRLTDITISEIKTVVSLINGIQDLSDEAVGNLKNNFTRLVKICSVKLERRYCVRVSKLPLDQELLISFAAKVNDEVSTSLNEKYPLNMFADVTLSNDRTFETGQVFAILDREHFMAAENTRPIVVPDYGHIIDQVRLQLTHYPLELGLERSTKDRVVAADPYDFWRIVKTEISRMITCAKQPMIITDQIPIFMLEWESNYASNQNFIRPADFNFNFHAEKRDQFDGYSGEINGVMILSVPFPTGFLIAAAEHFKTVYFKADDWTRIININYEDQAFRRRVKANFSWNYDSSVSESSLVSVEISPTFDLHLFD